MAATYAFHIVGIGSSAGGIQPLKSLISFLPVNTYASFVVVQHLLRTHRSSLEIVLSLVTSLKVYRILNRMRIEPGCIYVLPENHYVTIKNGLLILRKRLPEEVSNYGIDVFFKSLAKDAGKKAIGIVLSGANEDGAHGAIAITENNGVVFVQDPDSAEFPNMPNAVIRIVSPEEINVPQKLATALLDRIRNTL